MNPGCAVVAARLNSDLVENFATSVAPHNGETTQKYKPMVSIKKSMKLTNKIVFLQILKWHVLRWSAIMYEKYSNLHLIINSITND